MCQSIASIHSEPDQTQEKISRFFQKCRAEALK